MEKILVDTSVWINFFKDNKTGASDYLDNNINDIIIATCPTIIQEVLQGVVKTNDYQKVNAVLNNLVKLIEDPYDMASEAAGLYRKLRKEGITIRKSNDCLIAIYAIKNNMLLLHDDRDFEYIASKSNLKTVNVLIN